MTFVVALPEKGTPGLPPVSFSISGRAAENVTVPGPRNFVHRNLTGRPKFRGGAPEEVVSLGTGEMRVCRLLKCL